MKDDSNKIKAVEAIWNDPARVFGCEFRNAGNGWKESQAGDKYKTRGALRLSRKNDYMRVFCNHGSGLAGLTDQRGREGLDVFTFLGKYELRTGGNFYDTLKAVAEIYGFSLEFSPEERQRMDREELARKVAPVLIEALRKNPGGAVAAYLRDKRGFPENCNKYFGELSDASIESAKEYLKNTGTAYEQADFSALGLTRDRAAQGYALVIPYLQNGRVKGFLFRDVTGNRGGDKYRFSAGLTRGGFCDALKEGERAVLVEGEMDALRLMGAGVLNVVAMGGPQMNAATAQLLRNWDISTVVYFPDFEYSLKGEPLTDLAANAVKAFQTVTIDGEQVIKHLSVVDIQAPADLMMNPEWEKHKDGVLKGYKVDADAYGKNGGNLSAEIDFAKPWYEWELDRLTALKNPDIYEVQDRFDELYKRCAPFEKGMLKQAVSRYPVFEKCGITADTVADIEGRQRERKSRASMAAAYDGLKAAYEAQDRTKISEAVGAFVEVLDAGNAEEWEQQLGTSFDDELDAIRMQPDTLQTKWELGKIGKADKFCKYSDIEFWPADIAVFCAATSHGKTAMLFQSALDLVEKYQNKTFLYVSCEENKRQLLERALNVYTDIPTTENGKTAEGKFCFIEQTRKKAIKAAIRRDAAPPFGYGDLVAGRSEHFNSVADQVMQWVNRYKENVWPRLKFIHTEGTAESIAANALHFVKECRNRGEDVGAIFVDYMQLLTSEGKSFSRHDELKDVCKALKGCAAVTELPVIIAAQLNREVIRNGIDEVSVANIGEGADIERIAHDIWLVWNIDKTKTDQYQKAVTGKELKENPDAVQWDASKAKDRARRIFNKDPELFPDKMRELKRGYLYCECMKARDGRTDGWGLLPFDGERGHIGENDKEAMKK